MLLPNRVFEPDNSVRVKVPRGPLRHYFIRADRPESLEESQRLVHDGLARLPVKYRLPVVYAAIDGLDYPSIAAMLGVPLGTVKTLIFRGKRMLREEISRQLKVPYGN